MWCCLQIAASLKGSAYLEALDMGGNNITADGIKVNPSRHVSVKLRISTR